MMGRGCRGPIAIPLLAAVLFLATGSPESAWGQSSDSVLEARTAAIAAQLRCPVCQGVSIQDSPSELAREMRGVVRDQLREGRTPEEIKAYFVRSYGEWVLLEPRARGLNILLYALPVALVLGGLLVIVRAVRRWTGAVGEG
jgi:cytochrome c-type biogenesis protein CcmH